MHKQNKIKQSKTTNTSIKHTQTTYTQIGQDFADEVNFLETHKTNQNNTNEISRARDRSNKTQNYNYNYIFINKKNYKKKIKLIVIH